MDLQDTFYLVGIIYMIIMTLVAIGVLVVAIIISTKVNRVHRMLSERLEALRNLTDKIGTGLRAARYFMKR